MTTMVVTMLLGWFLGMFGWMAIAAIVAVFLIYVFKGKQAAAVAGVVIVAVLIGLRSFPGWRSLGGPGRVLTAKEQKALEHARKVKLWKKLNKGGEEEVNKAAAAMAAESAAMGAMG